MIGENQCIKNGAELLGHIQMEVDLLQELGYQVFLVCNNVVDSHTETAI